MRRKMERETRLHTTTPVIDWLINCISPIKFTQGPSTRPRERLIKVIFESERERERVRERERERGLRWNNISCGKHVYYVIYKNNIKFSK